MIILFVPGGFLSIRIRLPERDHGNAAIRIVWFRMLAKRNIRTDIRCPFLIHPQIRRVCLCQPECMDDYDDSIACGEKLSHITQRSASVGACSSWHMCACTISVCRVFGFTSRAEPKPQQSDRVTVRDNCNEMVMRIGFFTKEPEWKCHVCGDMVNVALGGNRNASVDVTASRFLTFAWKWSQCAVLEN